MIDIKFKPCCNDCGHRKIYTKESKMFSGTEVYDITTIIGCEHEEVCKEYMESEQPKEQPENAKIPISTQLPELLISGNRNGDIITSIIYEGTSETKALEIYHILEGYRIAEMLIPIGVYLTAQIIRVSVGQIPDVIYNQTKYTVIVDAKLVQVEYRNEKV